MKIFPKFIKINIDLESKWWHRVFVILFFILMMLFLVFYFLLGGIPIPETSFNIDIKYNLREFTRTSSQDVINTIPAFNLLNYKIGCLKDNKEIDYVSNYNLKKSACSSNLRGNIEQVAETLIANNPSITSTKEGMINYLNEKLDEDVETRYCFIHNDVGCNSDKIITYERNIIYSLESFIAFFASVYLFALILQVIYFRGLIYIIYGKKKS